MARKKIKRFVENFGYPYYDVISNLPGDVIQVILDRMPLKSAVKTSAISRNWRYKWADNKKHLHFYEKTLGEELSPYDHVSLAHYILLQHRGYLNRFALHIPYSVDKTKSLKPIKEMLWECIEFVYKKGVQELSLGFRNMCDLELTNLVLSCSQLTSLRLSACELKVPSDFRGFPKLVSFDCTAVDFLEDSFEQIISRSPLLSCLTIERCTSPYDFRLCSNNLKHLEVERDEVPCESVVDVSAKNLETLDIVTDYAVDIPLRFTATFCSLGKVQFSCPTSSIAASVPLLLDLFDRAPNLEELELQITSDIWDLYCPPCRVRLEEGAIKMVDKLKFVKICMVHGIDDELILIKLLLSLSPSLEKMVVVQQFQNDQNPGVLGELMGFPRISSKAQLNYSVVN